MRVRFDTPLPVMKRHLFTARPAIFFGKPDDQGGGNTEPKTLAEALTALASARETAKGANEAREAAESRATAAEGKVNTLTGERDSLKTQFESATTAATTAQAELKTAKEQLATATTEHTATKGQLTFATDNVTRLEKLCGLHGVDPTKAVPSQSQATSDPRAALVEALTKAEGPLAKGRAAEALRLFDDKARKAAKSV